MSAPFARPSVTGSAFAAALSIDTRRPRRGPGPAIAAVALVVLAATNRKIAAKTICMVRWFEEVLLFFKGAKNRMNTNGGQVSDWSREWVGGLLQAKVDEIQVSELL